MNTYLLTAATWIADFVDLLQRLAVGPKLPVLLYVQLSVIHHEIERNFLRRKVVRSERVLYICATRRFPKLFINLNKYLSVVSTVLGITSPGQYIDT